MGNSNLTKEAMDMMRDSAELARSYDLNISDRYVCDKGGLGNLHFPDELINPDTEWEGEELFSFGDMGTVNKPMLKMSY